MNVCEICNRSDKKTKYHEKYASVLCPSCLIMCKTHPIIYIPPKGELHYDNDGNILCHECGRGFKKLAEHIKFKHHLCLDEYREKYGLNRTARLTGKNFIKPTPTVDISVVGAKTRFKKNHTRSRGKTKRLQYLKNRIDMKYTSNEK